MIRRVFWLAVGAAGGIMGYRRAAALGRRLSGQRLSSKGTAGRRRPPLREAIRATRAVRGFSRDVREGMELYSARGPRGVGPTLPPVPPGGTTPRTPRGHARSKTDRIGHANNDTDLTEKDDR